MQNAGRASYISDGVRLNSSPTFKVLINHDKVMNADLYERASLSRVKLHKSWRGLRTSMATKIYRYTMNRIMAHDRR